VLQDYIHAVEDAEKRIARLVEQIEQLLPHWSMAGVVKAIQAIRGVAFVNAVTIVAEIGDSADGLCRPRAVGAFQRR
jgi:transposase